jgi:hypothetical protein
LNAVACGPTDDCEAPLCTANRAASSVIDQLMICDKAVAALVERICDQTSGNSMIFLDPARASYTAI